jgi:hypothetical protein
METKRSEDVLDQGNIVSIVPKYKDNCLEDVLKGNIVSKALLVETAAQRMHSKGNIMLTALGIRKLVAIAALGMRKLVAIAA